MKKFIKVHIEPITTGEVELIMAKLSDNNFYAFENDHHFLNAYIKEEDFNEHQLQLLLPENIKYSKLVIDDRNWNEEWETNLQPVVVNNFAGIRAFFHQPLKNVQYELIITPKMSFGTGHHPTTFLMIEAMSTINFKNKKVIDFGTGTGVLAILAEKMGASSVLAIDFDEWSINNARENVKANSCKKISIEKRDNIIGLSSVDIIVANINFTVLQENAKYLSMLLSPLSLLIISGFLSKDEAALSAVFIDNRFTKKNFFLREEWLAMVFEKL